MLILPYTSSEPFEPICSVSLADHIGLPMWDRTSVDIENVSSGCPRKIEPNTTGNSEGTEGGPWDEDGPHPAAKWRGPKRKAPAPTLEDMLRAWLKNRSAFDQIDEIIEIFESGGGLAGTGSQIVSFKASLALIKRTLNEPAAQ